MSTEEKIRKLLEARALIAEPEHWARGALARRESGVSCGPLSNNAHSFCLMGAITNAAGYEQVDKLDNEVARTLRETSGQPDEYNPLAWWNDTHTHAEVLQLFDGTIARLEAQLQGAGV